MNRSRLNVDSKFITTQLDRCTCIQTHRCHIVVKRHESPTKEEGNKYNQRSSYHGKLKDASINLWFDCFHFNSISELDSGIQANHVRLRLLVIKNNFNWMTFTTAAEIFPKKKNICCVPCVPGFNTATTDCFHISCYDPRKRAHTKWYVDSKSATYFKPVTFSLSIRNRMWYSW